MGRGQTQVEVEAPQRREREGLRAPPARSVEDAFRRSEQRLERQRFGGERAGDGWAPAGVADCECAFKRLPGAGQRRVAQRQRVRPSVDLRGDRNAVGGENGRRLSVEERRQGGDRRDGRGQIAIDAGLVAERERTAERKLGQRRIEREHHRARRALRGGFRIVERAGDRNRRVPPHRRQVEAQLIADRQSVESALNVVDQRVDAALGADETQDAVR